MSERIPMQERRRRASVKRAIAALDREYRRLSRLCTQELRQARSWGEQDAILRQFSHQRRYIVEEIHYLERELPPHLVLRDGFLWRMPAAALSPGRGEQS